MPRICRSKFDVVVGDMQDDLLQAAESAIKRRVPFIE